MFRNAAPISSQTRRTYERSRLPFSWDGVPTQTMDKLAWLTASSTDVVADKRDRRRASAIISPTPSSTIGATPLAMSAKSPVDFLSNPDYDYANVYVRWAVRLNNNGEFTHHNPAALSPDAETHGCINMSEDDARAFYDMVIEGDPVEVVNSPVMLSAADGDIYDWAVPWEQWQRASALT